jgi:hypothetical protein
MDSLFPGLDDVGFADAYAQTIVFAMLLARLDGIVFQGTPLLEIGRQLSKKHLLIGRAFQVLLDSAAVEELRTIETLHRIVGVVDFNRPKGVRPSIYVDLYEKFLASYDPSRRKESGSYYTPEPVARSMVSFVDQILRTRLAIRWGFADDAVVVVDPAMGTGTFLVEVVQQVADTVEGAQGAGARNDRLRELLSERLVGFEVQVAPYAITELRIHQALSRFEAEIPSLETRFLTDALEDPVAQQGRMGSAATWPLERSRQEANRFKRDVPVMVVIGNPPHVENTKGQAPWIEQPRRPGTGSVRSRPSLDEFRVPGLSRYTSDLHGTPWLVLRWALWKTFEAHREYDQGVIAFIVPASLLVGKAFRGVRRYLRSICDEGWIFELSPEGNRPKTATRIFGPAVSRQLCIAIFARSRTPAPRQPRCSPLPGNPWNETRQARPARQSRSRRSGLAFLPERLGRSVPAEPNPPVAGVSLAQRHHAVALPRRDHRQIVGLCPHPRDAKDTLAPPPRSRRSVARQPVQRRPRPNDHHNRWPTSRLPVLRSASCPGDAALPRARRRGLPAVRSAVDHPRQPSDGNAPPAAVGRPLRPPDLRVRTGLQGHRDPSVPSSSGTQGDEVHRLV